MYKKRIIDSIIDDIAIEKLKLIKIMIESELN